MYVKISWNLRVAKGIHLVFLYFIPAKTIHTKFYCYENRKKIANEIDYFIHRLIIHFLSIFFSGISWIFSHITSRHNVQTFNFECCIFRFAYLFTLSNTGYSVAKCNEVNKYRISSYSFRGNYSF